MCLLGSRWWIITFRGPKSPKKPILGAWINISAVKTSPRQSLGSRSASSMLVAGCSLTGSNWTRTRLNCSGLGQDTAYLNSWSWSIYTTGRRYCPSLRPCVVAQSNYLSWSEPRPPCVRRQFGVLLLATTASTSSPITRRRIGSHTGSRLCYVQGWLL